MLHRHLQPQLGLSLKDVITHKDYDCCFFIRYELGFADLDFQVIVVAPCALSILCCPLWKWPTSVDGMCLTGSFSLESLRSTLLLYVNKFVEIILPERGYRLSLRRNFYLFSTHLCIDTRIKFHMKHPYL